MSDLETTFYFTLAVNGSLTIRTKPNNTGVSVAMSSFRHSVLGEFDANPLPGEEDNSPLQESFNETIINTLKSFVAERLQSTDTKQSLVKIPSPNMAPPGILS